VIRTVYLARHGETDWNRAGRWQGHTDIDLNDQGRLQAHALGQALIARGIVRAHASDLARARATAEIVATLLGLPGVTTDAGFRERGFGLFEGLTREECEMKYPAEWAQYKAVGGSPPGGEPRENVVVRMRAAVIAVAASLAQQVEGAALAVTHGGALRLLVESITGVMPPPLENGAVFQLDLQLDLDGDRFVAAQRIR
jgi:broad specificity phosphatase PhoE